MKQHVLLTETIQRAYQQLTTLTEDEAARRLSGPGSWSGKEELGHLIDSAANNHLRFTRAAIDGHFEGERYAQNDWVRLHGYHEMPWPAIVNSWAQYNLLIARLIERIPQNRAEAPCQIATDPVVTLRFLIDDYVSHMRQHLDHIMSAKSTPLTH